MTKPQYNLSLKFTLTRVVSLITTCLVVAACGGGGGGGGGGGAPATGGNNPPPANNPPPVSNSPSLTVSWQAPQENVDGSPISGISEYRIYYGESSGQYPNTEEVPGTATSHTIDLPVGEYFLVMTAIDIEGDESGYSNEVSLFSE